MPAIKMAWPLPPVFLASNLAAFQSVQAFEVGHGIGKLSFLPNRFHGLPATGVLGVGIGAGVSSTAACRVLVDRLAVGQPF